MKIIILTGKFGMGHMMAAYAIKQHIDSSCLNSKVEVVDWLDYISPKIAEKYYHFFHFLVSKGNKLYNARYRLLENKNADQKPELNAFFQRCFHKFIKEKKPDMVISTLPLCSQIMSRYKEETGSIIPLITCVTDITGHSEWINKNTNLYLVGSKIVADKFMAKGVLRDKIVETGLPVRLSFVKDHTSYKRSDSERPRTILIMGGGLGMLPKTLDFYHGLDRLPNTKVTIITGKNTDLFESLNGRFQHIKVLGYVQNVHNYMRQADIIITKPGGITTFEAIYAQLPIFALNPLLQQEIYNAEFIEKMGIGTVIRGNCAQCLEQIENALQYSLLESYRNNIQNLKEQLCSRPLADLLEIILNQVNDFGMTEYHKLSPPVRKEYDLNEKISFNI